jgi:uncharacterized protein
MKRVIHFEINADQPDRAAKFYHEAFGWKIDRDKNHDYWVIRTGNESPGIDGGILKRIAPGANTVDIIEVSSLESTRKNIGRLGGECFMPDIHVAEIGTSTYCRDTEGNIFGLLEPIAKAASVTLH